jgi:glycosyltransferase involved in cell wall biosynthesis
MKHLIICREYPNAPGGGIGTYVDHISHLLAESGETVHVIGQLWDRATQEIEEKLSGRLIIHRLPLEDWTALLGQKPSPLIKSREARAFFDTAFYAQSFSWQAALLAEKLIEQEGIDLVEAQEYEASLYYFQLRRALGLGPNRQPPCIVHLHSPTELIAQHDDWNLGAPLVVNSKRLEDYSIAAADALLCPSRYLAKQVETQFALQPGHVTVIPYPTGNNPVLMRNRQTWEHGAVLYFGRLERRKGVIEWLDAAVEVAYNCPSVQFEFVGLNILGTDRLTAEQFVEQRIPPELKSRFRFYGQQKRSLLPKFLAGAKMAVVPSRWENFPNTCIEAMSSGLPVIATRNGGMAEMIHDGRSGWLTAGPGMDGLQLALKRALATPVDTLIEMGQSAAQDIRQMCNNEKIVGSHLEFRRSVVKRGANRSLFLPGHLTGAKNPQAEQPAPLDNKPGQGIVIILTKGDSGQFNAEYLQSLARQSRQPAAVIIVDDGLPAEQAQLVESYANRHNWPVVNTRNRGATAAKNAGLAALIDSALNPAGVVFLTPAVTLHPEFLARCESILTRCPDVGLISCWVSHPELESKIWLKPCPGFPYQWAANDAAPFSVIRSQALRQVGGFRGIMGHGYEDWDLFNAIMAAGWVAVTVPEVLATYPVQENSLRDLVESYPYATMRREMIDRFPNLVARHARDILLLSESSVIQVVTEERSTANSQLELARRIMADPVNAVWYGWGRVKSKVRYYLQPRLPRFLSQMVTQFGNGSRRP